MVIYVTRPAQIGGTIRASLRLAAAEVRRGRDVRYWSLIQSQQDEFDRLAEQCGVSARHISATQLALNLLSLRIGGEGRALVHLHSGRCQGSGKIGTFRRLMGRSTPFVVTLHGPSAWEPERGSEVWQRQHREACAHASAVIVPSEPERRFQLHVGLAPERVFVVPNIVEKPSPSSPETLRREQDIGSDRLVVGFVGRLVPQKGPDVLIRAFGRVLERHPDAVLVLAGDGPLRDRCRELARPLGQSVRFLGHVGDVGKVYAALDLFAAPSSGESFGLTAAEAALAGVPMVLSRIPPWTDVFTEETDCRFVRVADADGLAAAVGDLLSDRQGACRMAESARQKAGEQFSEAGTIAALDRAYEYARWVGG